MQRDEIVEAKEVHVRLPLEVARAELAALPEGRLKDGLRRAIEYAEFWNFRRGCEYVEAYEVDFHFTGFLNPPAYIFECNHPENRGGNCEGEKCPLWVHRTRENRVTEKSAPPQAQSAGALTG